MRNVQQALVAFGGNLQLPDRNLSQTILSAANDIKSANVRLVRLSRLFASPCFPAGAGPDYVNAVGLIETSLTAADLLAHLHRVEADYGRERVQRWGQRTLDLDLLAMGDLVLPDAVTQDHWRALPLADQAQTTPTQLILPHPRLQDRAFVLVPLADVAPDWRHPRTGLTVRQMLNRLEPADIAALTPL